MFDKEMPNEQVCNSNSVFENRIKTVKGVAKILQVTPRYIYKLVAKNNGLPHFYLGRCLRFDSEKVIEWLNKGGTR